MGCTIRVRAVRGGRSTPERARVFRIMTSRKSSRSFSGSRGSADFPEPTKRSRNSSSVPKVPGRSKVTRLKSSLRFVSTGVAVSMRKNLLRSALTTAQPRVARFLRWCASSTMTRSNSWRAKLVQCAALRAKARLATSTCPALQKASGSLRKLASWVVSAGMENFSSSSDFHCPTRAGGTRTSARRTWPRIMYSLRTMQASIVFPNPTSSASSTRPRNRFRTRRTVST